MGETVAAALYEHCWGRGAEMSYYSTCRYRQHNATIPTSSFMPPCSLVGGMIIIIPLLHYSAQATADASTAAIM